MVKLNLTEEDKAGLIEAINKGVEPKPDLLPKLFPGMAEKFDVQTLDHAKIPTLEYAGKRSKAAILAEAHAGIGAAPLQTVRCMGETKNGAWKNLIVQGDNLQFLKTCYRNVDPLIKDKVKAKVKLIFIDPPFGTGDEYGAEDDIRSYTAKLMGAEFMESLRERLIFLKELLTKDGSIFVRLDHHFGHYMKVAMDEIFGINNFRNEIIVRRGRSKAGFFKQFDNIKSLGISYDTIFFYSKDYESRYEKVYKESSEEQASSGKWHAFYKSYPDRPTMQYELLGVKVNKGQWKLGKDRAISASKNYIEYLEQASKADESLENYWRRTGEKLEFVRKNKTSVQYWVPPREQVLLDNNWFDIPGYSNFTGYPTENSEQLLERVVSMASKPSDLVIDIFGGSGTTAAVAEKLGRRWITCDFGKHSIYTMQRRLLRIGESKALMDEQDKSGKVIVKKGNPYKKAPKPFCVVSSGAYDFSHVMDLRKHKETYIDFVLALFGLVRDEEKVKKYRLANIYSLWDNHPVEVYPVWDDEFLKQVKIDANYLRGIATQAGGRLKGEYYIITPESCTNVGDTTIKNQEGRNIHFLIKPFPYKVLEDISRNFVLCEQPSSQANVNNLITSTAFYFNDDVKIKAKRCSKGFKLCKFETKILDREGKKYPGFSGLAMLLIDLDYEPGKPFDMDKTIFASDIAEDGKIIFDGLTESVGLIAIDKHGNESKPYNME